ncbi:hypothetical protein DM860_004238 [Cuscuta australis]|uniref:Uncharacterized protein n=2 Tax=Cuscuta sect. Cleistogrammica TaxID=1824901 RepID=A0A328E7B2_9ASTE|nr:hypothetical protein DM860_004238 [Cuscuta australis]
MMEALLALPSSSVSLQRNSARTSPAPCRHLNHRSSAAAAAKPAPKLEPSNKPTSYNSRSNFSPGVSVAPPPPHRPLTSAAELEFISSSHLSNLNLYADIASNLAQDGKFQDFLTMVENVASSAMEAADFVRLLNVKQISTGIARRIEEGSVGSVVELLGSVQKLQIDPRLLLVDAASDALRKECQRIVEHGQVEEFVTLMETLQGYGLPIKEFAEPSKIIRLCVRKLDPGAAIRYARIFSHAQILLCTIILEFGKKGNLESALTVFEASKQGLNSPNMFAYRAIIDACGLCGDFLKSRAIYKELISQGATPNTYVFNSLMNVNACDLSYTLSQYRKMKELCITADMTSYNILLKSCCLAGRVDLAKNIYKDVKSLELTGALKLDVFTYSTLIKVFADAKMWQMALEIKQDMISAGVTPNVITWSSLISACANSGLVDQAIQLFKEMLQAGCKPSAKCCNSVLHACVEAYQYDRAFRLFRSWKENRLQDNYKRNIDNSMSDNHSPGNCASSQNCTSGSSLELFSIEFIPTTSTYNTLMKACGTDYHRAKALMDEMKTAGLSPNHISWSILISICGSSGNVQGAMQILRSMHDAGIQPDLGVYTAAIKTSVEHKYWAVAFSLLDEMKKSQIKPNMAIYNALLRARSRYGSLKEVQQCLTLYQEMRKAGYKPDDRYLKHLIEEWCEGVIQNSHRKEGQRAYKNMTCQGPESLLLEKVAEKLQKSNALSVDLRELSKIEARLVVLAVLRMIKEAFSPGDVITDDLQIVLGDDLHESGVRETIIKLLQHDLGLEVALTGSKTETGRNHSKKSSANEASNTEKLHRDSSTRRPTVLPRLKITKESLHRWLQKNGCF